MNQPTILKQTILQQPLLKPCILFAAILLLHAQCLAHSGATFIASPIQEAIEVDGDLSDWPELKEYKLSVPYLFGGKPDTKDFTGRFRVGCDYEREILYVAVEVIDDHVNLESPADMWNSRDVCEIFLTLKHSRKQEVPLQFVYRKTPIVAQADEPKQALQSAFHSARKQQGNNLTYEWRIDLAKLPDGKGRIAETTVFGFDVGYVDLDNDGDVAVFSSSPGSGKHLTSLTLGDLILDPKAESLFDLAGEVKLPPNHDAEKGKLPSVSVHSSSRPELYIQVPCSKSGKYSLKLPAGTYFASLIGAPGNQVDEEQQIEFEVKKSETPLTLPTLEMKRLKKPDLIGQQGLLLDDGFDAEQVDRFVAAFMKYHAIPGLSLAIVKDGEVVYGKGFGVKSLATDEPVTDATVFEVASMTKPMFAYAVCRLAERAVIDLDKPLWTYLPYPDVEHDERYKKITARMVLCHRTGFPNWRDGQLKIFFEPNSQQQYSGEAYGYLANVVSHLTGKEIERIMADEVFLPLGIENTFLTWDDDADDALVAMPHDANNTTLRKGRWSDVWVAGCLHVDAANFAKFIRAIIHEQGLSAEMYAEMLRPQADISVDSDDQNFSLGFLVSDSEFGKHYGHGGHNTGFTSAFETFKDRKFGYVVMVNNYQASKIHEDLNAFLVTGRQGEDY